MKITIHKVVFENKKESGVALYSKKQTAVDHYFDTLTEEYYYEGPKDVEAMDEWREHNNLNGGFDTLYLDSEEVEIDLLQLIQDKGDKVLSNSELSEEEKTYTQNAMGYANTLSNVLDCADTLAKELGITQWLKSEESGCFYKAEGSSLFSWAMLADGTRSFDMGEVCVCPAPKELARINAYFGTSFTEEDFPGR